MKTIEIISWENAYESYEVVKLMEWLEIDDVLTLFESDPDILTINGHTVFFIDFFDSETNTTIVIYVNCDYYGNDGIITSILSDFYEGSVFYPCDSVEDKKTSIQYRGGKGYFYSLFTNDK